MSFERRKILSSDQLQTHFITKTKVAGTLKNTKHVIPVNIHSRGESTSGITELLASSGYERQLQLDASKNKTSEESKASCHSTLNDKKSSKVRKEKFAALKRTN